jgi:hypothetical protein
MASKMFSISVICFLLAQSFLACNTRPVAVIAIEDRIHKIETTTHIYTFSIKTPTELDDSIKTGAEQSTTFFVRVGIEAKGSKSNPLLSSANYEILGQRVQYLMSSAENDIQIFTGDGKPLPLTFYNFSNSSNLKPTCEFVFAFNNFTNKTSTVKLRYFDRLFGELHISTVYNLKT